MTVNVAEAWPAGIVTERGTVAWSVALLESVTTSGSVVGVLRETVASRAAVFEGWRDAAKLSERAGPLDSITVRLADAPPVVSTVPLAVVTWAVMMAVGCRCRGRR